MKKGNQLPGINLLNTGLQIADIINIHLRFINYQMLSFQKTIILLYFLCVAQACRHVSYTPPVDALFTKLTAAECGVDFRNDVKDDSAFNEVTYRNFYNGGGVAIGDINNDGLADIFMTANQGKNKLFLNKGNFQFEDITDKAGIVKKQQWSTGVTMADVNGDGLLDIYVCAAGSIVGDARKNALYINQGNLAFKEEADKYHLADSGAYHTQAAFFDYDLDGDLDVFLLTNDYRVPTSSFPDASYRKQFRSAGGDKLLRNDHGVFTDVSEAANIFSSKMGFGLGITLGDVNGDCWPDIYISNDFFEKDYLYINQRNGSFREESDSCISHMSQTSMGADIADIDNDGLADIFSTDMLPEDDYRLKKNTRFDDYDTYNLRYRNGYHHQILSNMLHHNNGDNTFSEISQYAGVNATDWSWGALIFDMDNDGWKDILVCNGMYLDVTDNDYIDFIGDENKNMFVKKSGNASVYEMLKSQPVSSPIPNYAFINQRNLTFKNKSAELGLAEPCYSNGAAYADLDNDGSLDLVVNNLNGESFVYRNNSTKKLKKNFLRVRLKGDGMNTFGIGASVTVYAKGVLQTIQNFPTRGFQSCVEPVLTFGLDTMKTIDSIIIVWPNLAMQHIDNIPCNQELVVKQIDAYEKFVMPVKKIPAVFSNVTPQTINGNILHKENQFVDFDRERLMPHLLSREGPSIAVADINGDGLEDFVMGAAKHDTTKVYLQTAEGNFRQLRQPAFESDADIEDAGMAFLDIDKDGDQDLVLVSGGNLDKIGSKLLQPRVFMNNGKGIFTRDDKRFPFISVNASCVKILDFNGDGYADIFIGGRSVPGEYGLNPKSYLLRNDHGIFNDVTAESAPGLQNIGMVTDAVWEDLDHDGKMKLVLVGEWMPITIFKNEAGRLLPDTSINKQFAFTDGWWNCIKATDLDNDGHLDLIAGNLGLNTKIKGDSLHPARLYINDFDKNGTPECVLTYYKADGRSYTYYQKNDLVSQIPMLKKKFLKHEMYAGKPIEEIFDKSQLESAIKKEGYEFRTCVFINKGKGTFEKRPLPKEAQFSPVYAVLASDFDKDGWKDILLAGNMTGLKPELGRYDAGYGVFLKGFPNNKFAFEPPVNSGFFYNGEGRDLRIIQGTGNKQLVLLGRNNESLLIFKNNQSAIVK